MQLLNVHTLQLTTFCDRNVSDYAILSHTWEDEEILFEDICDAKKRSRKRKNGWLKVQRSFVQAMVVGYSWVWIDTCCINKSSSVELSEAINSMFQWYKDSSVCYAYVSDVTYEGGPSVQIVHSRWFTRGWTLQELIAPSMVVFYDNAWRRIGQRQERILAQKIVGATGLPDDMLTRLNNPWSFDLRTYLDRCSVSQRFSWASHRSTKRLEDEAYFLLGIFGVTMQLRYGEGSQAFFRLQQEILKNSDDQSILAFRHSTHHKHDLLAESPRDYHMSHDIRPIYQVGFPFSHCSTTTALSPFAKMLEIPLYLCPPAQAGFSERISWCFIL